MDANAFTASFCPTISDRVPGFTTFMTVFVKLILSKASSFSILCRLCAVSTSSSSSSKSSALHFIHIFFMLFFQAFRNLPLQTLLHRPARQEFRQTIFQSVKNSRNFSLLRFFGILPALKTSRSIPKRRFFRFS